MPNNTRSLIISISINNSIYESSQPWEVGSIILFVHRENWGSERWGSKVLPTFKPLMLQVVGILIFSFQVVNLRSRQVMSTAKIQKGGECFDYNSNSKARMPLPTSDFPTSACIRIILLKQRSSLLEILPAQSSFFPFIPLYFSPLNFCLCVLCLLIYLHIVCFPQWDCKLHEGRNFYSWLSSML